MPHQNPDPFVQARDFFLDNFFPSRTRTAATPSSFSRPKPFLLTKSFLISFACAVAWFAAAFFGLWQTNSAAPWSQFDVFSVSLLGLLLAWFSATGYFHREMFVSREVMLEASGMTFDKLMFFWIDLFAAAEVLLFYDYGHWHLVPQLRTPVLQVPGLMLCVFGAAWLIWTDAYLSRQFHNLNRRSMMCSGPYRFVRHPRYAGIILSSIGISLALASVIGLLLAAGWFAVNVKRVHLEDGHLRELFGAEYEAYAARTARFFPGIY
jgi:protein-S-isoprenylcysteine O-methyltransferase Ste14